MYYWHTGKVGIPNLVLRTEGSFITSTYWLVPDKVTIYVPPLLIYSQQSVSHSNQHSEMYVSMLGTLVAHCAVLTLQMSHLLVQLFLTLTSCK